MPTIEKARAVNKAKIFYGTFAEIGAGQETARFFFQAGGASSTITKTMSAYDMVFSDAIYGPEETGRYVCEPRLQKMLAREFDLILERLEGKKKEGRCYFSFANTVATGSYSAGAAGHGWVGVRFQAVSDGPANEVRIHVRMTDKHPLAQQEALGIVGVNLIFAALFLRDDPQKFVESLLEDLDDFRLEVDSIRFNGPYFNDFDNRLMEIELVRKNLTKAVMFDERGEVTNPSEYLYRKHVVALRGMFRPLTRAVKQMIEAGVAALKATPGVDQDLVIPIAEISMHKLIMDGDFDPFDFLARIDMLASVGIPTLVTSLQDDFSLVEYLHRYSSSQRALIQGTHLIPAFFDEKKYSHLRGGILEAFGLMLSHGTKRYFYPVLLDSGTLRIRDIPLDQKTTNLFNYLLESNSIVELSQPEIAEQYIRPSQIVTMIEKNQNGWEKQIPTPVANIIRERSLFGCKS